VEAEHAEAKYAEAKHAEAKHAEAKNEREDQSIFSDKIKTRRPKYCRECGTD